MNATDSRDGLRELLEAERDCCGLLAQLLEGERQAAAGQDIAALLRSNKEREAAQARWERIAGRRREWLRRAGSTLDEAVRGDGGLESLCADLRGRAAALRRAQSVNHGLVRAVLGQINGLIATIRRELPTSRYDQGAALTAGPLSVGAGWRA